jgi:predicted nucleic acid-binding protein
MIAADTSSLSAFLAGEAGNDVNALVATLRSGELRLPPVVVTEILSDMAMAAHISTIDEIETLEIFDGYWHRAASLRRTLKPLGFKSKVADALIAQSCIDHGAPLITRDEDFRHFAKHCGLKLV